LTALSKLPVIILLVVPALAAIYGVVLAFQGMVSTADIVMCIVGVILTEYGVTFGYHRFVVHKSFEPHPVLKAIVLALGSMAWQGPVVNWASTHTKHHALSDKEGDVHSPTVSGFLYAHCEWLLEMSSDNMADIRAKWGGRYLKDTMIAWFDRTFLLWAVGSLILPAAIVFAVGGGWGAWTGLIWGGFIRVFASSHITWAVNSVCHYYGARMFKTTDQSRNNPIIGILALGEGWHNNHHAFPTSAFHGLAWWQFDFTGLTIRIYEKLGLVSKVQRIPEAYLERRRRELIDSESLALQPDGTPNVPVVQSEEEPVA
jgi:stearoyl-CoA desaturase (Delta-9 desaturase)